MKLSAANFIIIQLWMVLSLKLSGQSLLLYAFLYSFGQGTSGFEGSDLDLREYVSPIIPKTSFYRALNDLFSRGLIRVNGNLIMAVVPESVRSTLESHNGKSQSQNGTAETQNGTTETQNGTDTYYKKIIKEERIPSRNKSQFSDPNELALKIKQRREHGFS